MFAELRLMPPASDPVQIGEWLVDPRDDSLKRGAERVKLEPRTMRLLMRLAQSPGDVVSHDELLESVWTGVVVSPASVYQSMSQLRKLLGDTDDPPRYVETVARKGYRLVARVGPPAPRSPAAVTPAISPPAGPAPAAPASGAAGSPRKANRRWLVLAVAIGLATLFAVWQFLPRHASLPAMASIVVLPFIDLSDGKSEQTFCDGLTEETSNWLAQIPTLRVVARTSAFAYRGRNEDVRAIGRELHTSHVLEGSLRRSGDRMRITVQLIDTQTGFHLWSDSYNVEAGDVLRVQEDVARQVAGNLELRISAETDSRFDSRRSRNAQAQEMYLNAKAHALKFDNASNEQAITLYREALKADPSFALAKVWLAQAISNRQYFTSQRMEDLLPEILPLLAEAEKAAPQLVDLYVVRGAVYTGLRQRDIAIRDLKRALEMSPNTTQAASMLGYYYLTGGEPREALTYYTMASALDMRDFGWHGYRCMALTDLGQFEEAEKACALARSLGPSSPWVHSISSSLAAAQGRLDEAIRYSQSALERDDDIAEIHAARARWLQRLGLMKEAGDAVRQAVAASPDGARRNVPLLMVGAAAAIDAGGAAGLTSYVREFGLGEATDPSMLFELANAWLAAGQVREARTCVDRALSSSQLTSEDLASPWKARTGTSYLLISAVALRATGDAGAADRRLDQLDELLARTTDAGVRTSGLFELKAQLAAQQGRADVAMAALQQAAQLGWTNVWQAEHEPYFDSLRDRQDFQALLAAARAKNAGAAAKLRDRLLPPAKGGDSGRPGGGKTL